MAIPTFKEFLNSSQQEQDSVIPTFEEFLNKENAASQLAQPLVNKPFVHPVVQSNLTNKERFKDHPSRDIPILGHVLKALDSFSSNKAAIKVGEVGRAVYTPGAGLANVAALTTGAGAGLAKIAPNLVNTFGGRVAQTAIKEAVVGAPLAVGEALATGKDGKEALVQGAYGAALGGALGGAGSAIYQKVQGSKLGDSLNAFMSKMKKDVPAPRDEPETFANPTRLKVAGTEDAFAAVIPKVIDKAKERMVPPLENENELAKWVRNHLNNDGHNISLNEVRALNYEDLRELAEEFRSKIDIEGLVQKTAYDMGYGNIYEGIPAPIKERIAYDAQSRVYGVPAPDIKIRKQAFNERTAVDPSLKNKPLPDKPIPHPSEVMLNKPDPIVNAELPLKPIRDPNDMGASAKSKQVTNKDGIRTDGLTIMEKYFPSGKVDPQILAKLPLEERLRFQDEIAPGYKKPVGVDSRGLPLDASHLKNTPDYLRDEISRNNTIAVNLGLDDQIEELFSQGLTSKEVRQKLTYKLPSDYNEAKSVVESVRTFRGIPSSSEKTEFDSWLKNKGGTKTPLLDDEDALNSMDSAKEPGKPPSSIKSTEPRIKEKINDYFDEAEQSAVGRLRLKKGSESIILPDEINDRAVVLASQLSRKNVPFSRWYGQMIEEFGEESKNLYPQIWGRAEKLVQQAELRAKVIAHVPGVNQGVDSLNGDKVDISRLEEAIAKSFGWKNKNRFFLNRETTERNFEDIMGDDAAIMKKTYIEPIQLAAADRQRFITNERKEIKELGIKYNSEDDKLVQEFGEGLISEHVLRGRSPENWKNIKRAAEIMRGKYDTYLDLANEVLEKNGYDAIPKRKNYFPHYEEVDGILKKFGLGFEDNSLPTDINGLTANLKPGKNFFNHALQRTADESTLGALAGHDRYIEGITKLIYQTSNIKRLRGLEKYLRTTHEGTTHLNDFVANLTDYTNVLAGKKTELDRSPEAVGGRNLYTAVDWLKRRVGANMIGGSVSAALTNSIPVTQLVAATNKASVLKGLASTVKNIKGNDEISANSNFLNRKFTSDKLAMGGLDKAQNIAGSMFKFVDHFTSNLVIRAKYAENLKKGMPPKDALHAADQYASRMMADRSEGSMPTLFHSRGFGAFTQFQLEINNQVSHLFKDLPRSMNKKKYAGVIAQTFIYSYLYNELYEKLTGNRPAFDPIGITVEAIEDYKDGGRGKGDDTWNLTKNIAGSLPFSSIVTGGRIPLSAALPDVEGIIRGKASIKDEILKPIKYLALPFAGAQVNKTITGATNLGFNPFESSESGVYGKSGGKDVLKYPIEKSSTNIARGLIFGKNAFPETDDFYKTSKRQLSTKQTEQYESLASEDKKPYYEFLMNQRKLENLRAQYDKALKNNDISDAQKQKQLEKLTGEFNKASN